MTELWIIKILLCIMYTLAAADSCRNKKERTCANCSMTLPLWPRQQLQGHHLENPSAFFCRLVPRGLLRFITIIAGEHLLNVKRFLGIFKCFAKAKLHLLHSFWEFSLMEYSAVSSDSGYFMILVPWFDHALKQKHNHEWYSNIFALQTNLPLSEMNHFYFLGFLIHFILWVRTRSLAEVSWHCWSWALNQMPKHCLNVSGKIKFDLWNLS